VDRADLPLSRALARAVEQRTRSSGGGDCCAACNAGGHASSCESASAAPKERSPVVALQRAEDPGILESIWDTLEDAVDYVGDFIKKVSSSADLLLERSNYGPVRRSGDDTRAPRPMAGRQGSGVTAPPQERPAFEVQDAAWRQRRDGQALQAGAPCLGL
jgi:hypothetical protein